MFRDIGLERSGRRYSLPALPFTLKLSFIARELSQLYFDFSGSS